MFERQETMPPTAALDALRDLESNRPDHVKQMRSHERLTVRARVTARPGNSSQRYSYEAQGVSGDISQGGCLILFTQPLTVGDVFWLVFDKQDLPIDPVFARSMRCRMVNEEAFEVGFRFFAPVDLTLLQPKQPAQATGIFD